MAANLKDILSHLSPDVDQETLLLYLQNKLTPEKMHEVEKKLLESRFEDEAVEGLSEIKDKERIHYLVESLNRDLRRRLEKKRKYRQKMKLKFQPWFFAAILILLLLIVLSYIIIRRLIQA